ncbi:hypothetical protein CsSME_00037722 [Camellia sinensis var. sinensis]
MMFYGGIAHNFVRSRLTPSCNEGEDSYSSGELGWCVFESLVSDMRLRQGLVLSSGSVVVVANDLARRLSFLIVLSRRVTSRMRNKE